MSYILNLETSTHNCSVAIAREGDLVSLAEEHSPQYIHSEKLHLFIERALREAHIGPEQLAAVAVGRGPGSYTGLRIGVAAAKGFCYALGIPLLAADGLQLMVDDFLTHTRPAEGSLLIPLLDARRMEVYGAYHRPDGTREGAVWAQVIDENSFANRTESPLYLLGEGAVKCREQIGRTDVEYVNLQYPSARQLARRSYALWREEKTEDLAYFEPFYLKEFVAGKPKKLL